MAISAETLNIILAARDKEFTQAMERSQKRVERFAQQSQKQLSKTGKSFDALSGVASKFGVALSAGVVASGFARMIKDATDAAVRIDNLSRVAGLSAERFQEMTFAAGKFGVQEEKLADILKDVNDKFGDFFQTGAGPLADFFENIAPKVGLTAKEFKNLSSEQAIGKYVKGLQDANVSQQELTFYLEAIASDATLLAPLFLNNSEQLERMAVAGRDLGVVMSNDMITNSVAMRRTFDEVMDVMTAKFNTFALTVVAGFDKIFNISKGEQLKEYQQELDALNRKAYEASETIRELATDEVTISAGFFGKPEDQKKLQQEAIDAAQEELTLIQGKQTAIRDAMALIREQQNAAAELKATLDALQGGGTTTTTTSGGVTTTPAGTPPGSTDNNLQRALDAIFNPFLDATEDSVFETGIKGLKPLEQELARLERRRDQMIENAKAAYKEAGEEMDGYDIVQIENIAYAWFNAESSAAKFADTQSSALSESELASLRAAEALKVYTDQLEQLGVTAAEFETIGNTMQSSMESAFMSMVDGTGSAKDAFKSMAADIIRQLYRVLVVQRIVGKFGTATSAGSGILGAIGKSFGITGAASGRSVNAGQPYMTGEHGRELFVPSSAGRVLSVAQSKAAVGGGGGSVVVNQTINVSTGVQQTVRTEIRTLMPQIANAAKAAVVDAKRRGGSYGKAFS
jgi:hypothetical protein